MTSTLEDLAHYSGDPWKPTSVWWQRAETGMPALWNNLVWPFISDCDFTSTLDLAAGHGRNSAQLLKHAKRLTIMDIQSGNIEACRKRFAGESATIEFVVNNGYDMQPVKDASLSLVYCFDSMVHFDSDVVRSYLRDTRRVLAPGGRGFFHHSNSTLHSDWKNDPNGRNFMTAELFKHYAEKEGLTVGRQKIIDWAKRPNLDCLSLVVKQS
jgi:ubiquinone/menaquinone biosynthesis C-methylase UbiE